VAAGRAQFSLEDRITSVLRDRSAREETPPGFRRAAVLLPLYETRTGPHLILTVRTKSVPTHKGQISFPGGGFEERDVDLRATALREAEEEIGLHPANVAILGRLDETVTVSSRHVVRPFVGLVPHPYAYRPDPYEIERLIHLPIHALLQGAPFREELWERDGRPVPVFFYEYDGQTIWGLTARILKQFVEVVGRQLTTGDLARSDVGPAPPTL
jgi:8-oxo-dGTP pyrophosphatase MutT (NUDIX family)